MEEEGKPEDAVHTDRQWHTTCCVDRRKRIPHRHATGCWRLELGKPLLESQRGNPRFAMKALGGMTNEMAELDACAAVLVALDCMDNSETGQHVGQDGR